MSCRIDGQPHHWFRCARGTVGCPRCHDGLTPHCIACTAGDCQLHAEPVVEMHVEDFVTAHPEASYLLGAVSG